MSVVLCSHLSLPASFCSPRDQEACYYIIDRHRRLKDLNLFSTPDFCSPSFSKVSLWTFIAQAAIVESVLDIRASLQIE